MIRYLALFAGVVLCASCSETTNSSVERGFGTDSVDGSVNGTLNSRSDGGYSLVLNKGGRVCTAVFESFAATGKSDLSTLNCTKGGRGTATIVYRDDGQPESVVYAVTGAGGGTIRF